MLAFSTFCLNVDDWNGYVLLNGKQIVLIDLIRPGSHNHVLFAVVIHSLHDISNVSINITGYFSLLFPINPTICCKLIVVYERSTIRGILI